MGIVTSPASLYDCALASQYAAAATLPGGSGTPGSSSVMSDDRLATGMTAPLAACWNSRCVTPVVLALPVCGSKLSVYRTVCTMSSNPASAAAGTDAATGTPTTVSGAPETAEAGHVETDMFTAADCTKMLVRAGAGVGANTYCGSAIVATALA